MNKENIAYIHSGDVLTKEQTDAMYKLAENPIDVIYKNGTNIFIIPTLTEKPIKIVYQGDLEVERSGDNIEVKGKICGIEAEKIISNIFGTTDIGVIDCENIKDYTYYCPTCKKILDLSDIDSCMNTPSEIVDYCLECGSIVIDLRGSYGQ